MSQLLYHVPLVNNTIDNVSKKQYTAAVNPQYTKDGLSGGGMLFKNNFLNMGACKDI